MKKNLRLLCLGLAAATATCGFAQEDMTSLLKNPTMEAGVKGWSIAAAAKPMGFGNKNTGTSHFGFHGMSKSLLEAWNSEKATVPGTGGTTDVPEKKYYRPVGDGYAMQRLSGLKAGTYVFGAYAGAALQTDSLPDSYKSIEGVTLFANDNEVIVQTNNPESKGLPRWAHTGKYNVAVTLTDADAKKGYLDVGLRIAGTNANFVMWDNATLYYFGDMSEADALDAMAKIDIQNSLYIADTLRIDTLVMNVDTLKNFTDALDNARNATVTAANLWELNEGIYYNKGLVHKSVTDYANLKKHIASAQKNVDSLHWWTEDNIEYVNILAKVIAEAQEVYDAHKMNRKELEEFRKTLSYAVGDVRMDSVFTVQTILDDFINEMKDLENQNGGYSTGQIREMEALQAELGDTVTKYENDFEKEERTINPNDLYPYVNRVLTAIQNAIDSPMSTEFTEMPIVLGPGADGFFEGTVDVNISGNNLKQYTSELYQFPNPVESFTLTVKHAQTSTDRKYFCISELQFFDAAGVQIEMTEENFSSKYDHNTLNPNAHDGQGLAGLCDDDVTTYFHSAWGNIPAGDHSIEVTLPNGGYKAFNFKMISRPGQPHQFPASIVINTPTPERDNLVVLYERLVNLNPYTSNEVGFYSDDFSAERALIAELEEMLAGYPTEAACAAKAEEVSAVIAKFNDNKASYAINLPDPKKAYHVVSGFPDFAKKQHQEKALTVHYGDKKQVWWEPAGVDSVNQKFMFEPVMDAGEHMIEEKDGALHYYYTMKNVETGLYVNGAFVSNTVELEEVAAGENPDTVFLVSLGRGQWNIKLKDGTFHAGDHNGGTAGTGAGAYGGIWGIGSAIVSWGGGLDGASAWYIREMTKLPVEEVGSACYHFDPVNNITLTATDVDNFTFTDLKLRGLLGDTIAIDTIMVSGKTAHIITPYDIVECAVDITGSNAKKITLDGYHYVSNLGDLQAAYDAAVAKTFSVGDSVGQCKDITAFEAVLAEAAAMLENGASDEAMEAMIKKIEKTINSLEFNMPDPKKYYQIVSAVDGFVKKQGYPVSLYVATNGGLVWGPDNDVDNTHYWQFEQATKEELQTVGAPDTIVAFWVKNVGTKEYIGGSKQDNSNAITMAKKADALPYFVKSYGNGAIVGLNNIFFGKGIHAMGHGSGGNRMGTTIYYNTGAGDASSWRIIEVEYDATGIDFAEVESEKAVVKGTYDLFGRRIAAPTAPGLYIIDGKKVIVK